MKNFQISQKNWNTTSIRLWPHNVPNSSRMGIALGKTAVHFRLIWFCVLHILQNKISKQKCRSWQWPILANSRLVNSCWNMRLRVWPYYYNKCASRQPIAILLIVRWHLLVTSPQICHLLLSQYKVCKLQCLLEIQLI